jgi:hypothetical protein
MEIGLMGLTEEKQEADVHMWSVAPLSIIHMCEEMEIPIGLMNEF